MKGPEDYQNYFHVNSVSGHIWLDGKNQPVPKEPPWQSKLQIPSLHQIFGMLNKLEAKFILIQVTLLIPILQILPYPRTALNLQVITKKPFGQTNYCRIDNNF